MNKTNNLRAYLRDLYEGIVSKKPDASRNPQNFRSEIEAIRTGGEFYEVMDESELPNDAPDGSLALVEGEPIPEAYTVSSIDELPSNAVDGSMAIVESDNTCYIRENGEWVSIGGTGGGNTAPIEGTAIPVGVPVEKIYFNTNLSVEETYAYLSQLTYVQTPLLEYPINIIAANEKNGDYRAILAFKYDDGSYDLEFITSVANSLSVVLFNENGIATAFLDYEQGAKADIYSVYTYFFNPLSDFNGIPVGAENEKIKNVLSITPFVGTIASNEPTAYTVSSVDELPSNAVDGSMAIVESDSIEGTWFLNRKLSQPQSSDMYFEFETFDITTGEKLSMEKMHYDEFGDGWEFYYCNEDSCNYVYYEDSEEFYWEGVLWRYIRINTQIPDEIDAWIRANGRKLSSLYTHENGEWIYKCEVV
jgi:hypothetical protein